MKVYKIMINMDINCYAVPYFTFQPIKLYKLAEKITSII